LIREAEKTATGVAAAAVPTIDGETEWDDCTRYLDEVERNFGCCHVPAASAPRIQPTTDGGVPRMPVSRDSDKHRMKHDPRALHLPACVARPVSKSEIAQNPSLVSGDCKTAHDKEWQRLVDKKVWDFKSVKQWSDVARLARQDNRTIHMGRIFGLMVEKNHELPKTDPRRKFKYRVVFQGNNVCTQNYEVAIFQDLGSSPASMESSKSVDCFGCFPGHDIQQADAEQAYVQAELTGVETWVAIPEDAWPEDWWVWPQGSVPGAAGVVKVPKYNRPVCKLLKAL
jgi:hypothetical protein